MRNGFVQTADVTVRKHAYIGACEPATVDDRRMVQKRPGEQYLRAGAEGKLLNNAACILC